MIEMWNTLSLTVVDFLLGGLLRFPPTVAIVVVSVGSGAVLTLARLFTTDQETLRIAAEDRRRQKEWVREAKARKDKAAAARHNALRSRISLMTMNQEGKPMLVALPFVAMLATWAVERLEFHPPSVDEPVFITAYVPRARVGETLHLVPRPELESESGWISEVRAGELQGVPCGIAEWTVRAADTEAAVDLELTFRMADATLRRGLILGGRTYAPARKWFPDHQTRLDTELETVKPFGIVPGIPALAFPPWLVGYVLLVVPSVFLTKRLFGIY